MQMAAQTKKLPVGISDFREIVTGDYCYVDKTLFIKEVLDKGDKILLLPRPRRFGKTLNLSMLKYFYDCCPPTETGAENNAGNLFASLAISKAGDQYMEKVGQSPVIFLSFKDIKVLDWETSLDNLKQLIQAHYLEHKYLLESKKLEPEEKDYFKKIIDLTGSTGDYGNSLRKLLIFLNRYYQKKVVILIDEYDAPIHAGFNYGYYDQIINFMRNFLSGGLKDADQYLEKSVITGIMRVAKESIFSGLNNPGVYTLLAEEFSDKFGFTEKEVENLLTEFQLTERYEEVRKWYNGYRFGETVIYNPWSIINFLGSKAKEIKPYWINTSDNKIVETLLSDGGKELKEELELLIQGESIEKVIEENIVFKDIPHREDLLWSFLLMGGYLKYTAKRRNQSTGEMFYMLTLPNQEVRTVYAGIIKSFFESKIQNKQLSIMLKALTDGEIDVFEEIFAQFVLNAMSVFDVGGGDPEKVYHAFVMGLLLWLVPGYEVKSNRESGYGRYDIMLIPADSSGLGYVIEFKKVRKKETMETALESALKQIEEKKYETELIQRGIHRIKKLAIVFSGKEVVVTEAPAEDLQGRKNGDGK